jgi:hypothetical protein
MVVISLSITESSAQVVSGIPESVIVASNIPATIFYTLDGTDPTLFSNIYTGPIILPYNDVLLITLKVYATNGTDTSPILTEVYTTNILHNARLPHSPTDAQAEPNLDGLYPFGTNPDNPIGIYLNPGDAGTTVDNPALPTTGTGYDGAGAPTGFTNEPYNTENYNIIYSTTNSEGETGPGIGTLPAHVTVIPDPGPPEQTNQFSNLFDPRAFVIFQDFSTENPDDPPQINRMYFSLENSERVRDGNNFYNSGLDAPPVSGSFLRSHYNPRTNEITYYYLDSIANKWIISKTPYKPTGTFDGNLAGMVLSKEKGAGFVFEWIPFARRVLF